jgi:class 3 adenylate cyclase
MANQHTRDEAYFELRLFLEETCCNLCRFQHVNEEKIAPESVRIDQEVYLGIPGAFADIRVQAPGRPPYFVEVKFGYTADRIYRSVARKFGGDAPGTRGASKVVLVVDIREHANWPEVQARVRAKLRAGLELEIWDEAKLVSMLRTELNIPIDGLSTTNLIELNEAIFRAKGVHTFGANHCGDAVESSLVWHFGYWRLEQILAARGGDKHSVLKPGPYDDVVVLMADLASFSSYVRDTRDEKVVRNCLTSFYSKSRYQIINSGGMMYEFLGDAVIALFGVPDQTPNYLRDALECALALTEIGESVSNEWQRQIDRVQPASGVHVSVTLGELMMVPLQPYSRSHMGAVGDPINLAARLNQASNAGDIVASNTYFQQLDPELQANFDELGAVEAKNIGRVRAWRVNPQKLHRPGRP